MNTVCIYQWFVRACVCVCVCVCVCGARLLVARPCLCFIAGQPGFTSRQGFFSASVLCHI
jgi:hypothetical protein